MADENLEEEKNYEKYVDQDIKDVAEDETLSEEERLSKLQEMNAEADERLGGAKDYGIGDNNLTDEEVQSAVDLVNQLDAEKVDGAIKAFDEPAKTSKSGKPSEAGKDAEDVAETPITEAAGAFGTRRNEHFADRPGAQRIAQSMGRSRPLTGNTRNAEEAWKERYANRWAERAERDRGHDEYIANQMSIRRYGVPLEQRLQGGGMSWDGVIRNQNAKRAGRAVGYTTAAVQANKLALAQEKAEREEQAQVTARRNLSIYDAILAAGDDLMNNADNKPVAESKTVTGYILQDANGNQTTVAELPKELPEGVRVVGRGGVDVATGDNIKTGRVSSTVLQNLNQQILKSGADYAITGILAQQKYGANAPKGGVEFKVRIRDNDGTERFMTLNERELQQRLIRNHKAAGNDGDVNDIAISAMEAALGGNRDYNGYRKTQGYLSQKSNLQVLKHNNKMEEIETIENGKNVRNNSRIEFNEKKLEATIKKWGDDLKVREKNAKTAEEKLALEKERVKYDDYSKLIGAWTKMLDSPYTPEDLKDQLRQKMAASVNEDGSPNYELLAGTDNQTTIKPSDNSGDETQTDKNGITWRIIRDKNGKPVGKQRVK